jgi:hypothetical protein
MFDWEQAAAGAKLNANALLRQPDARRLIFAGFPTVSK